MLRDKILNKHSGILLYGLTPPKAYLDVNELERIAGIWRDRVESIGVDGIVLYDIQNETDRTSDERPFEFLATIKPQIYYKDYLRTSVPAIIYSVVGNYNLKAFEKFIDSLEPNSLNVFVGASSSAVIPKLSLDNAYDLVKHSQKEINFGGICIPERHFKKGGEHIRVAMKTAQGCKFFISQAVYNLEHAKKFIDDYATLDCEKVPIIFTFTPCGSPKTLEFMKWLGVSIPAKFENALKNSQDILTLSVNLSLELFNFLYKYALSKGISVGANVESISTRKVEIEASLHLLDGIKNIIRNVNFSYRSESFKFLDYSSL
ncbi:methylenetetrahydrofolate reductase [Campylobacter sp. faydin G-24]|uniref:Methylenetetrahydrofolate reductase n=1 Tax=Campylobacter anatolicus TaxID=2829105 RepID=A0ABS5HIX7_9BACT|nr:methylenetetrahydrofolate reductase [Campylobacter anatolicus]MBR8464208.1 methylenetetrahydrofolate reductase [Campylobacter anatolicus]